MKAKTPLSRFVLGSFLFAAAGICVAQGPPGHDPYNPPPGHGGVPPGQAKKHGYEEMPPEHAREHDYYQVPPGHGGVPPGQAKKYRHDYHFEGDDRGRFYAHYRSDAD